MKFSKRQRLLSKADFRHVLRFGQRIKHIDCRVLVGSNSLSYARLGMIVTKKNFPLAVQRNYIKRVIRESFRADFQAGKGDVIVFIEEGFVEVTREEQRLRLKCLWEKLAN